MLDLYVRVSRVGGREGPSFISPTEQREAIRRWAEYEHVELGRGFEDLDQSGQTIERPGFQAALRRVESGESGGLVVAKLDRFARSMSGAYEAIERIQKAGGTFVSVADRFDLGTPQGRLMFNVMQSFAQFELDRIRDQWKSAQRRAVARGVHIASRTPTGYVRSEDGTLAVHPQFGAVIGEVFRLRAAGTSWRDLCRFLDDKGVVGPYGAVNWRTRALQHVVQNRVYLGEARSGEFVNAEAHEPLTDRTTWEAAQAARSPSPSRTSEPSLLAGLIRCAGCRYVLKPDRTISRGESLRMYRCRGEHAAGTCPDRAASLARVVEPLVVERFFSLVGEWSGSASADSADLSEAAQAIERAESELAAYRDDSRILDALGQERFVDGLRSRVEAVEVAQLALSETRAQAGVADLPPPKLLRETWPEMDTEQRRRLLGMVIDAVMLRSGKHLPIERRVLILGRGEAPDDLPRRGRREPLRPFHWPSGPDEAGVQLG